MGGADGRTTFFKKLDHLMARVTGEWNIIKKKEFTEKRTIIARLQRRQLAAYQQNKFDGFS